MENNLKLEDIFKNDTEINVAFDRIFTTEVEDVESIANWFM